MILHSILFERPEESANAAGRTAPECLADLNLDQVIDAVTAGREAYDLKPFFYAPLATAEAVEYRQAVMRDIENPALLDKVQTFAQRMGAMRERLAQAGKAYYQRQREKWFLDAAAMYCAAVVDLARDLTRADLKSPGLRAFRETLTGYAGSRPFQSLQAEAAEIQAALAAVRYSLVIKDNRVQVRHYAGEADYSAEVEATFARFKEGAARDYLVAFRDPKHMNHVEAQILDFVAKLHPAEFIRLSEYCLKNGEFLDETVAAFDREAQFYLAYLEFIAALKRAGLHFCYPRVSRTCKEAHSRDGFDIALAHKLVAEQAPVVTNDFDLSGAERILVVTGPNQGGKTTFARAVGQMHYLAGLGCPVPGREAQFFLCDRLFTHFEKEENIQDLRGKLEDDLVRIHKILSEATPESLVILNEILTSTTVDDAVFLSQQIMERLQHLDVLGVWVTFLDELSSVSEKTVSMVSTVVPENPAQRTFKIVRRPADGLAYAAALAAKYGLTYSQAKERLKA